MRVQARFSGGLYSNSVIIQTVAAMDPFLRGFNEHLMDTNLEETEIQNLKGITRIFDKEIKSRIDAQLGFFLGYSYAKLVMQFLILKNRLPTKEETEGFFDLMKRRYPEVIATLKNVKTAKIVEREEKVVSIEELDIEPADEEPIP
jgi:hypothetical protein